MRKVDIMRRSNSKEVNNLIRDFVMEHFNDVYYPDNKDYLPDLDTSNYNDVSKVVLDVFYQEKVKHDKAYNAGIVSRYTLFEEWVSGLCSALPSEYYYNVSAVDLLGGWLDQTDDEKSKYSEDQAERMITKLLYRELTKHASMSER